MRLLLDESVPRPLRDVFAGHDVTTVQDAGWSGVQNGELLQRTADAGYDALVTLDAGFEYQWNLAELPVTVVLLHAGKNRLEDLEPLIAEALQRLNEAQSRTFIKVGV